MQDLNLKKTEFILICIRLALPLQPLLTINHINDKTTHMRRILILAVLLVTAAQAWSANVDAKTAQGIAQRFLLGQASAGRIMAPAQGSLKLTYTEVNSKFPAIPVYYIFNAQDSYVVVSGDDRSREILAYGDGNIDDMSQLPENMIYWLSLYKQQLEYLQAHPDIRPTQLSPQRGGTTVTPLISANWSQNGPYWNECPAFGADTCYTGCPATSLSMVFHYWKYPKQQTPAVPSYTIPSYGVVLPELAPTVFDWDNMLDNYVTGQYNDVQATAVAHLMRYIGQAEEMDYTISGSGAYGKDVLRAVKFFEYDQNAQLLFKTDDLGYANYSDTQWGTMIQDELAAGRPIVYMAYDNLTGGGHAFNVDGYDANDDTYHINWGWNGRGNGNFALNAFTYQDYTFGAGQQMVIGIQPPEGYQEPRLQAYPTTVDMNAYIGKPATSTISLKGTNLTGDVNLSLHDHDGVFTVDARTLAMSVAEAGTEITVTYNPQTVGTHTATLTCTSQGTNTLTITLNGNAPLEIYPPVLLPANENYITLTSFRADWTDETPSHNVSSYSLEIQAKPDYMLLEEADFSDLPRMAPTNQASHATDYLPDGWSFTGSEFNLEGGCVMPRRNGVITTDALSLMGYDKVTVFLTGRSYSSWGDPSELTISTSMSSVMLELPFSYGTQCVVLDCAEGDKIAFTAGYYPMIQKIVIYAGDASGLTTLKANESGNENYRLITGISGKSYVVRDLAAGGTFFYRVKAVYSDGTESDWTESQIVTLVEGTGHPFQPGDVNHDGYINIADVTALIDELLGGNGTACTLCADLNGDNNVNIADVTNLIDLLLSGN